MKVKGVNVKKKWGQNFIFDKNILAKIVIASGVALEDFVLEIGTGLGTLTEELAKRVKKVVSFEIDRELYEATKEKLNIYNNVIIMNEDIMKADLNRIANEYFEGKPFKVVANLPYYITSPIIMMLLECKFVKEITVLVQKEVAERICALPGTKDYGILTVFINFKAKPKILFNLPPSVFVPPPKVDSSLVKLEILDKPLVEVKDEALFSNVVKAAFGQRRKVLSNALKTLGLPKEIIDKAFTLSNLSHQRRGETLSIEEFTALANVIYDLTKQ
ncbi:16S rRNA (adenine(1518)-N(6)/adenine(1519)-N(6)) -dimethyltransferase RsmA [Thermoanaerobacter brockii subsp. lactiethylicus]|uniref:16S rRNA (adenine(1518)-N(6)/adenine(1519)-N(6))- dimethyltransferase RsmA n=1 Tax=Thermoanaerobacter sp. (strain X514) TaxID=399726 RepID=UPI0000E1D7A1|nr:16S rRNA (adenine(1518)-N(6)/adenine(1519)-N(6))-dimethyltransferase RsmA [Thermoanaerobacter sp. X514]ABY91391.1 dimethyladenosine transferase [Thermoanaerobacter sp. X514]